MYKLKHQSSNMQTGQGFKYKEMDCPAGPSSGSVLLVRPAYRSSWSVQLVHPAGRVEKSGEHAPGAAKDFPWNTKGKKLF